MRKRSDFLPPGAKKRKPKSALGNPTLKPCSKSKKKEKHSYHHHTEGGGFNYCDGYPVPKF